MTTRGQDRIDGRRLILLAALAAALAAPACKKTNACRSGTVLLDLRFAAAAERGDSADITVDVLDTPHETLAGTVDLIPGQNGGTVEVRFKNQYRAGARIVVLARAMRASGTMEEVQMSTTLEPGCSYILVQAQAAAQTDGGDALDQAVDLGEPDDGAAPEATAPGPDATAPGDGGEGDGAAASDGAAPADVVKPPPIDAAADLIHADVGASDGPCPGACRPGDVLPCGKCGSKICTASCAWPAACSNEGNCLAGTTRVCGNCGLQVCDTTCHWEAACQKEGVCKPGASMTCGNCGHQTCSSTCTWQACGGDGQCSPGATRTCGKCGTETCGAAGMSCGWSGVCAGEGACTPGSVRPCGNCGTETCGANCQWSGACQNAGECAPGDTGACGNCGTRTCGTNCHWPADAAACTGQGPCAPNQRGTCGNCGTITCGGNCQWPTGAAACTGQGVCSPGDSIDCGRCSNGLQVCTDACAWGLCKGGTTICCNSTTTLRTDSAAIICPCTSLTGICPVTQ